MKRIAVFLIIIGLLLFSFGCSSMQNHEAVVRQFLTAYFTGNSSGVANCVPAALRNFIIRGAENADWNAASVELKLVSCEKATEDSGRNSLRSVEQEYASETGVSLTIQEAYIYEFNYRIVFSDGDTDEGQVPFTMYAAKIDGTWYAFPADL